MKKSGFWLAALTVALITPWMVTPVWAGSAEAVAARGCAALAGRVEAVVGSGPLFLRSYDGPDGRGVNSEPALANAAFTYDNALAAIALTACGHPADARRIAQALLAATQADRAGTNGRLRNAYRAGPVMETPVPPAGWWDASAGVWREDAYQVGTATGNVAWAALALLTAGATTNDARFTDGAKHLARWAIDHVADGRGPGGFSGGVFGDGAAMRDQTWKSTEHNIDLAAVFSWLARVDDQGPWRTEADRARAFLDAMWAVGDGSFPIGTGLDGVTINRAASGLDAQLWPLLLADAPAGWRRSLDYVEQAHGVDDGFDFNADRDGVWLEGTAQAALAYRVVGRAEDARRRLALIAGEFSPGGYVWATQKAKITTGLSVGPDSGDADFFYFRWPHLGATAWAVLAATGWNPMTGRPLR